MIRAAAHSAGWQWQVPVQHRNGNGHVFCSASMEDQETLDILLGNIAGKPRAEPNWLRFVTDRRRKFWNRNVIALGLAAGFMEPFGSTSTHLINTGIDKLLSLLSFDGVTQAQEDAFNRLTGREYARIRDVLSLHCNATSRTGTEFWNHVRTMPVSVTLTGKVATFKAGGQIFREEDELFTRTSWTAVMMGGASRLGGYNAMADARDPTRTAECGRDRKVDPLPRPAYAGAWRSPDALLPRAEGGRGAYQPRQRPA